jgi:hypothetical protein
MGVKLSRWSQRQDGLLLTPKFLSRFFLPINLYRLALRTS